MQLRPNLNFAGSAAEVLALYQAILGGDVEITRFAGSPAAHAVPADWGEKILYARLFTPFGELDVMDAPPGRANDVAGNIALAIDVDEDDRAAEIFAAFSEGGTVIMPFEPMFFARTFGMVADRFGVRWMVTVAPVAATAVNRATR